MCLGQPLDLVEGHCSDARCLCGSQIRSCRMLKSMRLQMGPCVGLRHKTGFRIGQAPLQYSISKIGWPHGFGHTGIALHTVIRYTRIFGWIWGKNGIWKSSDRIWACSRLFFFLEKMPLATHQVLNITIENRYSGELQLAKCCKLQ